MNSQKNIGYKGKIIHIRRERDCMIFKEHEGLIFEKTDHGTHVKKKNSFNSENTCF